MMSSRSAASRSLCSLVSGIVTTAVLGAVWIGLFEVILFFNRMERHPLPVTEQQRIFWLGLALMAVLGGLILLIGLSCGRGRFEAGPSELVLHRGLFWQRTEHLSYLDITEIDTTSGPLMRLFGLTDLKIYMNNGHLPTTLCGLREGGEFRRFILERRAALREAAEEGDCSVARTPQEMIFERLDRVLERIERHLPSKPA